jgi:hypothetical protein
VVAHILNTLGYKLYIAGNFNDKLRTTYYFDTLENYDIVKIDTNGYLGNGTGISNSEFNNLLNQYKIDLTVFTEADNHISLFISQLIAGNKRFRGRVVGIFLRPWHFYNKLRFIDKFRYIRHLKTTWKSDDLLFHEWLNKTFSLIDSSLCIDEFFVSNHKKSIWLPDVFQEYADRVVLEERSEQRVWIEKLDQFKYQNKGSFIVFYFGTAQQRRGYDELLKLALDQNACFVHCGTRNDIDKYSHNVDELRNILKRENKLFETNEYIIDPYCIEYFFKSASHIVLPYSNFLGSSGVMLQALSYGIPVLVPDFGLIGYRVKKYNLGDTYSENSFNEKLHSFINSPKESFSDSITEYMQFQSADNLDLVLRNAFSGSIKTILHP